jgi:spore germination protein KA
MALVRKRIKTPNLQFEMLSCGEQSDSHISLCYIRGIASETLVQSIKQKIEEISIDLVADSSYIADLIAPHPHSIFQQVGTTEKPDIFTAKIAEGRVGILVDGTPIALTVPFLLLENFQAPDDYFTSPFFATIIRILRTIAVVVAILLPAFYVSSQLFKLQLLPLNLTLTIASSIQGIPLSPSLEMFLVLFVLEVIKEASIRMPKYVGMALSVVGALVLGETAVSAGFVSTPAIIIVAFSGLCLYTVPDFVETGTILRWLFLVVSGSFGPFGIVALASLLLYYLANLNSFSTPVLSPFVPLQKEDIKDSIVKLNMQNIPYRPHVFQSKNKRRMGKGEV